MAESDPAAFLADSRAASASSFCNCATFSACSAASSFRASSPTLRSAASTSAMIFWMRSTSSRAALTSPPLREDRRPALRAFQQLQAALSRPPPPLRARRASPSNRATASRHLPNRRPVSEDPPFPPSLGSRASRRRWNTLPFAVFFAPLSVNASSRLACVARSIAVKSGSCATACNAAAISSRPVPLGSPCKLASRTAVTSDCVDSSAVARKLVGRPLPPPAPPGSGMPHRRRSRSLPSTFRARSTSSKSLPFFDSCNNAAPPFRNSFLTRQIRCGSVSKVSSTTGSRPPVQGT